MQAARRQLANDCEPPLPGETIECAARYDGSGTDDLQWSSTKINSSSDCPEGSGFGVCLNNLDGSPTTDDGVNVTVQPLGLPANSFRVVSTGDYGDARRKIEAILQPTSRVKLRPEYYTGQDLTCSSNGQFQDAVLNFVAEDDAVFNSNCEIIMGTGNIYVGGSTADGATTAQFNSNTSITNGSIFVNGSASFDSNVAAGGGGGVYIRDDATFKSNTTFGNMGRMYVGRNATFDSNATVNDTSIYVGGNASFNSNSGLDGTSLFSGGNVTLNSSNFSLGTKTDATYGNWQNTYNPTARGTSQTGIGAVGTISGSGASKASKGTRSFDSTTSPRFVVPPAASPGTMTFPFDRAAYSNPLSNMAASASASRLSQEDIDALRESPRAGSGDGLRSLP